MSALAALPKFNNFENFFVGIDQILKSLEEAGNISTAATSTSYPPYNILKGDEEGHIFVELALAGFKSENIEVKLNGRKLIISAKLDVKDKSSDVYIYRGLAHRAFIRTFVLASDVELYEVDFTDGILRIKLVQETEEDSSKSIPIGYKRATP